MLKLNTLSPNSGTRKRNKRVGRGTGSGAGKTAARGHKGARARTGYSAKPGFEGGQMPLHRRLPKRGFKNIFKQDQVIISLDMLSQFESGSIVNHATLYEKGLISSSTCRVKILANGELHNSIHVQLPYISQGARKHILAAGGTIEGE